MSMYFFPGCKYRAHNPEGTQKLEQYLNDRFGTITMDCCSMDFDKPTLPDSVIFQCPTCGLILSESGSGYPMRSLYEFLLSDHDYPWPDYGAAKMTLQDCWRSRNNIDHLDAIRAVIKKMNIQAFELECRRGKADFCGATLYRTPSERYQTLAYQNLVVNGNFQPCSEETQTRKMLEHGKQYATNDILCYCTGCMEGIKMSGHNPIHLLDLMVSTL
ncbi:MAG: hypothetical protein HFE75_09580 [Firmicutes bacterium]|nr:hypothetical protein [Bacillota bacterium]